MISSTVAIWPIISALSKAALFLGAEGTWQPINTQQETFLKGYYVDQAQTKHFSEKELRSWASTSHEELNTILRNEQFTIQFAPFKPEEFGVVSILDVLVTWLTEGRKTEVTSAVTHKTYPAVTLKKAKSYFSLVGSGYLIEIPTKSGDIVYMAIADKPLKDFELINELTTQFAHVVKHFEDVEVVFPMVDLNQEVDISWLMKLQWFNPKFMIPTHEVSQAFQQTKFRMNEKGARAQSAVAIGINTTCLQLPHKRVVINKPFYLWIQRPGVDHPIFAAYIAEDDWKEQKGL